MTIKIDGIGKDAEIVTNEKGGKNSKLAFAIDLLPRDIIVRTVNKIGNTEENLNIKLAVECITDALGYMEEYDHCDMYQEIGNAFDELTLFLLQENKDSLKVIADVMEEAATRYSKGNWKKVSVTTHLSHALLHLYAFLLGDEQDDHVAHAITRVAMAFEDGLDME